VIVIPAEKGEMDEESEMCANVAMSADEQVEKLTMERTFFLQLKPNQKPNESDRVEASQIENRLFDSVQRVQSRSKEPEVTSDLSCGLRAGKKAPMQFGQNWRINGLRTNSKSLDFKGRKQRSERVRD
jgi:hypothetical protein